MKKRPTDVLVFKPYMTYPAPKLPVKPVRVLLDGARNADRNTFRRVLETAAAQGRLWPFRRGGFKPLYTQLGVT